MAKSTDGVYWQSYAQHDNSSPHFMGNRTMDEVSFIEALYRERLQEMSVNRFKWTGLPDDVDERFVEMTLFETGMILACKPHQMPEGLPKNEVMFLRGAPTEGMDYQYNPLGFRYYGNDIFEGELSVKDKKVQPIYANRMRTPDAKILWWYARRLAEVERTIDINLKSARKTRLLLVPEEQKLTAINVLRQWDAGEPAVLGGDKLNEDMFSTLDMQMQSSFLSDVPAAKNKIFNDCMTWLGIDNANQDKKERLVASEVDANGEQVSANRAVALNERKLGAERANELFGLNIDVNWADEYKTDRVEEENSNGELHDDATGNNGEQS